MEIDEPEAEMELGDPFEVHEQEHDEVIQLPEEWIYELQHKDIRVRTRYYCAETIQRIIPDSHHRKTMERDENGTDIS